MRYLLLPILLLSTSIQAEVTKAQYADAANELKSIYEIINNRGMKCDAALNTMGLKAVNSKHCQPFLNSSKLIDKIKPQCDLLLQWAEENPLNKDTSLLSKTKFIIEYCGERPPSRYNYIGKVFKKIQLMGE